MVEELKCNLHNTFKKSCTSERTGNKGQTIILFLFFSSQHTHDISLSIIWIPMSQCQISTPCLILSVSVCSGVGHICPDRTSEKCGTILSLQPHDKVAMLVANTITFFSKNLHEIGVQFPQERNAFVLDHQHGRHDVRCNPIMDPFTFFSNF